MAQVRKPKLSSEAKRLLVDGVSNTISLTCLFGTLVGSGR